MKRGSIVLLPFPFSDLSALKVRPAVVVSPPYPSDDLIVVALSSVAGAIRLGEFPIVNWQEAGLLHPSFAKRAMASVSDNIVRRELGSLSDQDLRQLDAALRLWLGL